MPAEPAQRQLSWLLQEFLEGLIKPDEKDKGAPLLVDYREHHTGSHVHFTLQLPEGRMAEVLASDLGTRFKLSAKMSTGAHALCACTCPAGASRLAANERDGAVLARTLLPPVGRLAAPLSLCWCCGCHKRCRLGVQATPRRPALAVAAGNMMLFDKDGVIKRYDSPEAILTEFFHLRVDYYARRRALLIQAGPVSRCPPLSTHKVCCVLAAARVHTNRSLLARGPSDCS